MNLLSDPWMPIRRRSGKQERIKPMQITEDWDADPVMEFVSPRPDFNAALMQFLLGLLQPLELLQKDRDRKKLLATPLSPQELQKAWAAWVPSFNLDGAGPRFMQEQGLDAWTEIGVLLLDEPGEQTKKLNKDLFIKRDRVQGLCFSCAAQALFAMQTNAPAGGAGYRTGLRGGGPLTLLWQLQGEKGVLPLWQQLAANLILAPEFYPHAPLRTSTTPRDLFPWLAAPGSQGKQAADITLEMVHPAQVYWAMPRRYLFELTEVNEGVCDLCGSCEPLLRQIAQSNYGRNYVGEWRHPLSPHYEMGKGTQKETLPVHPQPDGIGYRHWLALAYGTSTGRIPPQVLLHRRQLQGLAPKLGYWANGFDMDNMKVRNWHDARLPDVQCALGQEEAFVQRVEFLLQGAEQSLYYLGQAIKEAWYSQEADKRAKSYKADFVKPQFWAATEAGFYRNLEALSQMQDIQNDTGLNSLMEGWLKELSD